MKKIGIALSLATALFAGNIKNDKWFLNANIGTLKIYDSSSLFGLKAGYYFYDPNIYQINNRISVDFNIVDSNADFYITSLKLDWIKNGSSRVSPFVGLNIGYLYFDQNNNDNSAGIWGGELGALFNVTQNVSFELEACYQKAYEKTNIWTKPLKTLKVGLEYSF